MDMDTIHNIMIFIGVVSIAIGYSKVDVIIRTKRR